MKFQSMQESTPSRTAFSESGQRENSLNPENFSFFRVLKPLYHKFSRLISRRLISKRRILWNPEALDIEMLDTALMFQFQSKKHHIHSPFPRFCSLCDIDRESPALQLSFKLEGKAIDRLNHFYVPRHKEKIQEVSPVCEFPSIRPRPLKKRDSSITSVSLRSIYSTSCSDLWDSK